MNKSRQKDIELTANALSTLNTFGILMSILEGGHIRAPSYAAGNKIIKICKSEMQKCLRDYDKASARALK